MSHVKLVVLCCLSLVSFGAVASSPQKTTLQGEIPLGFWMKDPAKYLDLLKKEETSSKESCKITPQPRFFFRAVDVKKQSPKKITADQVALGSWVFTCDHNTTNQ